MRIVIDENTRQIHCLNLGWRHVLAISRAVANEALREKTQFTADEAVEICESIDAALDSYLGRNVQDDKTVDGIYEDLT